MCCMYVFYVCTFSMCVYICACVCAEYGEHIKRTEQASENGSHLL